LGTPGTPAFFEVFRRKPAWALAGTPGTPGTPTFSGFMINIPQQPNLEHICPTMSHLFSVAVGRANPHGYWMSHLSHVSHLFFSKAKSAQGVMVHHWPHLTSPICGSLAISDLASGTLG
jgi:hypothetical protein